MEFHQVLLYSRLGGLLFFFGFFLVLLFWLYRPSRRQSHKANALIPFDDVERERARHG